VEVRELAATLGFGSLLEKLKEHGGYEILAHWTQGEFHHDVVLAATDEAGLPGRILVVSTNCNGGIKEILCFADVPERGALWRARCPNEPAFCGELPPILASVKTVHWFDPCELLRPDARSELKSQHRRRQLGGGWEKC
jgi:hypothetical protein